MKAKKAASVSGVAEGGVVCLAIMGCVSAEEVGLNGGAVSNAEPGVCREWVLQGGK